MNSKRKTIKSPFADPRLVDMLVHSSRDYAAQNGGTPQLVDSVEEVMRDLFKQAFPQGEAADLSGTSVAEMQSELLQKQQEVICKLFDAAGRFAFMHLNTLHGSETKQANSVPAPRTLWRRCLPSFTSNRRAEKS